MAIKKDTGAKRPKPKSVEEYLRGLSPSHRAEVDAVRKIILGLSPKITEGIKWNAPSYALSEDFATFNAWAREDIELILHHGPGKGGDRNASIKDVDKLLEWLADDRARITFHGLKDVERKKAALRSILTQWTKRMR